MTMRVEQFLERSARLFPDKPAIVAGERRVSYRALRDQARALAGALRRHGLARGDRVVVLLDNSPEAVVSIFATLAAGGVFSVINPSTKTDKLAYVLNNCAARALITEPRLHGTAADAARLAPSVGLLVSTGTSEGKGSALSWDAMLAESEPPPATPGIDIDLAMIVYTSGSTGHPKGVMMTHRNIVAAATSITTYLESVPEDIVLSVLPLAFDYGLYQALMCVKAGATLVLEKSFTYPGVLLDRLERENVTGLPLVPTMAAVLLQMKDLAPERFPKLRYITNTAAALPPSHIQRLRELFPRARIYSMYGLTECKRCTYLPPEELARRPDSVGIAIPGTEAYVVDDAGVPVAPGVVGELVIRGPHVMQGYWANEQATARMLRPGPYSWEKVLYTGDLFRADTEGFLYFVGRKDDIIKSRGEKVSPKEVENVLYALPGVREAAVIGVPDALLGLAIKALLVLEAGEALSERDVIRHCAKHLEDFMVPRLVEFVAELPKTDTGKIRRSEVQARALSDVVAVGEVSEAGHAGEVSA